MGTSWTPGPTRPTNGLRPFGPQVAAAARRKRRRQIRLARTAVLFVALAVIVAWLTGGFSGHGSKKPSQAATAKGPTTTAPRSSTTATTAPAGPVKAQYLSTHLPSTLSRAVVATDGTSVLILGGLDNRGKSSATVYRFDPSSASIQADGSLAVGAHDATGVKLGSSVFIFGGGSEASGLRAVQSYQGGKATVVGSLPQARSDLSSVVVGSEAIVLGGYTGTSLPTSVLATSDGITFRVVAQLPVPVRYAGVAAVGNTVYVIGGEAAGVAKSDIQAIDLNSGTASVVGRLPATLTQETAFSLGNSIYLAGGRSAGTTTDAIWRFTPGSGSSAPQLVQEGTLPEPVADAPIAVVGQTAYLFGGETPSRSSAIVSITPSS
jgi:Kelch motif